jgi:flagellar motor switch protein FliN
MTATLGYLDNYAEVQLDVTAELGRTDLTLRQILDLDQGSIVELSRAATQRVDLLVGGAQVAQGTIVASGHSLALRIVSLREEG